MTESALGKSPKAVLVLATLAASFIFLPLAVLILRAPWADLTKLDQPVAEALKLTLMTATITTVLAITLGVPLGWVLERASVPGRRYLRLLITAPMLLPPVVGGLALIELLGRQGLLGSPIESLFGFRFFGHPAAVVVAQLFVSLPFMVASVSSGLQAMDPSHELAAATLGADQSHTLRRVTLPLLRPSIAAGAALTWARAVGELGATLTFAGSLPGSTRTMPTAILTALEGDPAQARLLSLVLLLFSGIVLFALRARWVSALQVKP